MGLNLNNRFGAYPSGLAYGRQSVTPNQITSNRNVENTGQQAGVQFCPECGGIHGEAFNHAAAATYGDKAGQDFESFKAQQYGEILAHEQAHQSAAGTFGGGISIEYDGQGVAVSGHVPISIPPLDKANPEQSYKNYSTIRGAALAPGDPSAPDRSIASQALGLMGQAQVMMGRKRQAQQTGISLGDLARGPNPFEGGLKPGKPQNSEQSVA